jgi:peptidoglycan/LPS O-acetylase OafA/YrhL
LKFNEYGWIGVELFFVISSYLFLRLLDNEHTKYEHINIRNFFIRRILRIYPLMICFSVSMICFFGEFNSMAFLRLSGIATFTDNIFSWLMGYNSSIPATAHLWTLAFEFQVYLFIPAVFLAWKRFGTTRFLAGLGLVYLALFSARMIVIYLGAPHPVVWVTPYLQPESVLIGMVLATGVFRRIPALVWPLIFAAALLAFLRTQPPWHGLVPAAQSYPYAAIVCLALVESVRNIRLLKAIFTFRPVVFFGTISFGLYVFHIFGIYQAGLWLPNLLGPINASMNISDYAMMGMLAAGITTVLSVISFYALEAPFLRLKTRFEAVHGRELASSQVPRSTPAERTI